MTTDDFYATAPSARTSWRLAILMGRNARTYKFALGNAPPDRLLDPAERPIQKTIMAKLHHHGGAGMPHRFYELTGSPRSRTVLLSSALGRVARSYGLDGLRAELDARWSIVENSFATGIGRSLIEDGVRVDRETLHLTDRRRRHRVTGVAEAVAGFQHGRCHICDEPVDPGETAVDHVFPYALMRRFGSVGGWRGPDLDTLWNLAVAHRRCNGAKSDRMPTKTELTRLARRNEAIMRSPWPLRTTLRLSLKPPGHPHRIPNWQTFLREVEKACA
ncbi:HNH endonuclease [Streptomyces sp. NPDC059788]|uniref:HNH endonuclease n=1 Tax=Streptomyces sp. NPDC059788 TaxID=3346948 RepID=UPI0036516113